jgi:hypothetical protein
MLELDPAKRADMEEIISDPWVRGSKFCRQDEDGSFCFAGGHDHVLANGDEERVLKHPHEEGEKF